MEPELCTLQEIGRHLKPKKPFGSLENWDKREFAKTLLLISGGHPNGYEQKSA
jgi:hypothetical protein